MINLKTPHISLESTIEEGLDVLISAGKIVKENSGHECCFKVETPEFSMGVLPKDGMVGSVWYDDSTGRESEVGRWEKVQAYLKRYGLIEHWELRLDNGWMHYWFNTVDRAQMVYGIHKDVIRFNQYREDNA